MYNPYVLYMTLHVTRYDLYGLHHTVQGVVLCSVDQQHLHLHQGALLLFACLLDAFLQTHTWIWWPHYPFPFFRQ